MKNVFILFFCCVVLSVNAQKDKRPVHYPNQKSDWLTEYQQNPNAFPVFRTDMNLPLTLHIVGTDGGSGYFPYRRALDLLCEINEDFEQYGIQFFLPNIELNYIDNSALYDHTEFSTGVNIMFSNKIANTINVFIVSNPADACGYYTGSADVIALAKGCLSPGDKTFQHEMGHFLSLPHPFYGWELMGDDFEPDFTQPAPSVLNTAFGNIQVEKVDGSNCNVAADGFCDTSPDYLADRWNCVGENVSAVTQIDPDGVSFNSDGTNFMSYSNAPCDGQFTADQSAAMMAYVQSEHPNLIEDEPLPGKITAEDVNLILPPNEVNVTNLTSVTFAWNPVENATHYILQISRIPTFGAANESYIVETNSYEVEGLDEDKTYYWRVRPFNYYSTCPTFSSSGTFTTNVVSSVAGIEGLNALSIFPNPLDHQGTVEMTFSLAQSETLSVAIYTTTGQQVQTLRYNANTGANNLTIPTANLANGVYFIGLESENGKHFEKLMIQR